MSGGLIAVFESTHETMKAERALKAASVRFRTSIKPRAIGSGCQMALTFVEKDLAEVAKVIDENSLKLAGFFVKAGDGSWRPASGRP